ncbi:MAG: hypothetical protein K2O82_07170 [Alistipes sp.]|nr:hypothetical protein [Alistipes sp.]
MKKILLPLMGLATLTAPANAKGRFETYDLQGFKLHVYYTHDAMDDASYIIEGAQTLVTMEHPLFKENAAEFDAYIAGLGKPVEQRIADYHVGTTGPHDVAMAEGMPRFVAGPVYDGIMRHFAHAFGDTIVDMPTGRTEEIAFGTTHQWAGVPFAFAPGASSDFPAASILIGGQLYYTHWAPARAHMSHLQINSPAAIEAEKAEAEKALSSGAELFIGGHGGAARADTVRFKIDYLRTLQRLLDENDTPETLTAAIRAAWPKLPGTEDVPALAEALLSAK